jgi:hypothetical protein
MQAFFNIGGEYPQARVLWEVPAAVGSIPGDQINSATPVHTSPAAPGSGYIRLKSEYYSAQYQNWLPTPAPYRSQGVKIYSAHFERDVDNEYSLDRTEPPPNPIPPYMSANCGFAAHHGYNGIPDTAVKPPWRQNNNGTKDVDYFILYDKTNPNLNNVNTINFSTTCKGDVVTYIMCGCGVEGPGHIETITAGGSGNTWGANTAADPHDGHWSRTSVQEKIRYYLDPNGNPVDPNRYVEKVLLWHKPHNP